VKEVVEVGLDKNQKVERWRNQGKAACGHCEDVQKRIRSLLSAVRGEEDG